MVRDTLNGFKIGPQQWDKEQASRMRRLRGDPEPFDDALQERFLATLQDPQFRDAVLVSLGLEGGVQ